VPGDPDAVLGSNLKLFCKIASEYVVIYLILNV
jgi:hypothetical protein